MSRVNSPVNVQAVAKSLGVVPNLFRVVGNSPAALPGAALDAFTNHLNEVAQTAIDGPAVNARRAAA